MLYLGLGQKITKFKLTLSKLNFIETLKDFENTNVRCLMSCIFADVRMWYCIWPSRRTVTCHRRWVMRRTGYRGTYVQSSPYPSLDRASGGLKQIPLAAMLCEWFSQLRSVTSELRSVTSGPGARRWNHPSLISLISKRVEWIINGMLVCVFLPFFLPAWCLVALPWVTNTLCGCFIGWRVEQQDGFTTGEWDVEQSQVIWVSHHLHIFKCMLSSHHI